jgi:hypothetical protein
MMPVDVSRCASQVPRDYCQFPKAVAAAARRLANLPWNCDERCVELRRSSMLPPGHYSKLQA